MDTIEIVFLALLCFMIGFLIGALAEYRRDKS